MDRRATATSYAILGLIAQDPGSAYDLGKRMDLNLAYFWPRATSHVFTEVKKLARLGWVAGKTRARGQRKRIVYTVTPLGRKALVEWLSQPPRTFALEIEGLVRLFLAPFGDRQSLLQALQSVAAEAETMKQIASRIVPAYLNGEGPAPHEIHLRALLVDFLVRFAAFVDDWATRSRTDVAKWNDLSLDGRKVRRAREILTRVPLAHRR